MLLYEEGNFDKSLIYSQLFIESKPNKYLLLLIQKNLYMISYNQIINNKDNEYINIFHPNSKITIYDESEYNCQAAQYFSYLHFNLLSNEYLLSEMKTLSKKHYERSANYLYKPDCFNDSANWTRLNNERTYTLLKHDTIDKINKGQVFEKSEIIKQSIIFKEEINASKLVDNKNKILKNTILVITPTVEYIRYSKSTFSYEKYYIHEKRKNNFYIKNLEISLNSFLNNSPYKKAYTSNQSIIVHLDKYNNKKHEESSILELKPNIDHDLKSDSLMQSKDIKYIVYLKVHVYENNLNPNLSKLSYNMGLSQLNEKSQLLLIADVYDIENKKYIIACRRIIGSRSKDLIMANWFDIFKSILP